MNSVTLRGLYAVTPQALCLDPPRLFAAVAAAIRGGARLVQYRDKASDPATRRILAAGLLERCREGGIPLIVNDDVALAMQVGADGVHLGPEDTAPAQARQLLGAGAIVGVSCANSLARAQAAAGSGASYVAIGRFHPSRTKPEAPQATLEHLAAARAALAIPLCAIGGITPENGAPLLAAGADLLAAVEGVFGTVDVEAAARAYARLFDRQ